MRRLSVLALVLWLNSSLIGPTHAGETVTKPEISSAEVEKLLHDFGEWVFLKKTPFLYGSLMHSKSRVLCMRHNLSDTFLPPSGQRGPFKMFVIFNVTLPSILMPLSIQSRSCDFEQVHGAQIEFVSLPRSTMEVYLLQNDQLQEFFVRGEYLGQALQGRGRPSIETIATDVRDSGGCVLVSVTSGFYVERTLMVNIALPEEGASIAEQTDYLACFVKAVYSHLGARNILEVPNDQIIATEGIAIKVLRSPIPTYLYRIDGVTPGVKPSLAIPALRRHFENNFEINH